MHWTSIPIVASEERLSLVTGDRLHIRSAYYAAGYKEALPDIWLRECVAKKLEEASRMLPGDLTLVLWDGWRPTTLQGRLYTEYRDRIARDTGLTGEALEQETQRFVALPSSDPTKPSPHLTGGTIDLTLGDRHGVPLDMGGEYDELSDRSITAFYEREDLTEDELAIRNRRRLLCAVLTHVGFSNYAEEWWHYDMGTQWHHARVGGVARYGPADLPPRAAQSRGQWVAEPVYTQSLRRGLMEVQFTTTSKRQEVPSEVLLDHVSEFPVRAEFPRPAVLRRSAHQ